jgi:hypothetical protein
VRRLAGAVAVALVACGGGGRPAYDQKAVDNRAAALLASGALLAPNGGAMSQLDLAVLLQVVKAGCHSEAALQAMIDQLRPNPYLQVMALQLAEAGCPVTVAKVRNP